MASVREICTGALRLLGITQPGRAPSAADMDTAVYALRSMLESWSTQDLNIFQTTTLVFPFEPGKSEYSLGPTGDWETIRPMHMSYCYLRYSQGSGTPIDQPITILNDAQRAAITAKSIQSSIPTTVYYNAEMPNAKLTFWPVPNTAYHAVLWLDLPLEDFSNLSDDLNFPRGYERAIRYNLALALAPEYGKTPADAIIGTAQKAHADLKMLNQTPRYLRCNDYVRSYSRQRAPSVLLDMSRM